MITRRRFLQLGSLIIGAIVALTIAPIRIRAKPIEDGFIFPIVFPEKHTLYLPIVHKDT